MRRTFVTSFVAIGLLAIGVARVGAQTYSSGSTGADGAFTLPNASCSGSPCYLTVPASGEFNFTTFTVPSGWTLRFIRNATNTPVIIRATGNVTINDTIDLNGARGGDGSNGATTLGNNGGVGGAGGFSGGSGANGIVSTTGGAGQGPGGGGAGITTGDNQGRGGGGGGFGLGGGNAASQGGSGGSAYGTAPLLPMIGGSGGGGGGAIFGKTGGGGGGGGGAIVIASSGTITLGGSGQIQAKGGDGGSHGGGAPSPGGGGAGSGGSVRLAATTIAGTGTINVSGGTSLSSGAGQGGNGAIGRIRIEAYNTTGTYGLVGTKASVVTTPNAPTLASSPTLRISAVAGVASPASPGGVLSRPDIVLPVTTSNPVQVDLTGAQIPLGTTVQVTVRAQNGVATATTSAGLTGTLASSAASVSMTIPTDQPSVISAVATFDRVAWGGGGPVYAEGERIERVRVSATLGGPVRVTYITASGRELAAAP